MSYQTDFINRLAPYAVEDMKQSGVPASLTIAQGILESNYGRSSLTVQQNNLFGIKGGGGSYTTKEYIDADGDGVKEWVTINANFAAYASWGDCVAAHSRLILNGTRDNPTRYHGVLNADYKTACYAIWKGGYATDPDYPQKLIGIIELYGLQRFDVIEPEKVEVLPVDFNQALYLAGLVKGDNKQKADWAVSEGKKYGLNLANANVVMGIFALHELNESGFINSPDYWVTKLEENAPNWLIFELFNRFSK